MASSRGGCGVKCGSRFVSQSRKSFAVATDIGNKKHRRGDQGLLESNEQESLGGGQNEAP